MARWRIIRWVITAGFICVPALGVGAQHSPTPVAREASPGQLAPRPGLEIFYSRLRAFRSGAGARLTLIQIGDSHTAADQFTARLRARFQADFGDAGRGQLAPGVPEQYWRPSVVRAMQAGDWKISAIGKDKGSKLPFGLSGYIAKGSAASDTMDLTLAGPETEFAAASIAFIARPGGGHVDVIVDGILISTLSTEADSATYRLQEFVAPSGRGKRLTLRVAGDGPVAITDWGLYNSARGAELISHGFVGAQLKVLDSWSEEIVATQLSRLDPALIVLAFGTNEGYAPASHLADYAVLLRERVVNLQRLAPNASIVLLMGPDANRIPTYCPGSVALRERARCVALTPAETAEYDARLARKDMDLCRWHTPASYSIVRTAQEQAARSLGLFVWDWMAFQGGACSATAWHAKNWVHNDRVHLKREGANRSADAFYDELLRGFTTRSGRP